MREITTQPYRLQNVVVDFAAVTFIALIGPFGTFETHSAPERFILFGTQILPIGVFVQFMIRLCLRDPWLKDWGPAPKIILGGLLGSVPGSCMATIGQSVFFDISVDTAGVFDLWIKSVPIITAIVVVHFGLLRGVAVQGTQPEPASPPLQAVSAAEPPQHARPAFLSRATAPVEGDLVSVSAQDHYIEIVTTEGRDMILMRFSDALEELQDLDGVQIHRSHWVARDQIDTMGRSDGRPVLRLCDGRVLPIAQSRLADVKKEIAA